MEKVFIKIKEAVTILASSKKNSNLNGKENKIARDTMKFLKTQVVSMNDNKTTKNDSKTNKTAKPTVKMSFRKSNIISAEEAMDILKCSKFNLQDMRRGSKRKSVVNGKNVYTYNTPKLEEGKDWTKVDNKIMYNRVSIQKLLRNKNMNRLTKNTKAIWNVMNASQKAKMSSANNSGVAGNSGTTSLKKITKNNKAAFNLMNNATNKRK